MARGVWKLTFHGRKSNVYYGVVKNGPGKKEWERVKLFADKTASERRLRELQREADQRQAGMITPDVEALKLPIKELRDKYVAALEAARSKVDHVRISGFMLDRLI